MQQNKIIHDGRRECAKNASFDDGCCFDNDVAYATKFLKYYSEVLEIEKKTAIKVGYRKPLSSKKETKADMQKVLD